MNDVGSWDETNSLKYNEYRSSAVEMRSTINTLCIKSKTK